MKKIMMLMGIIVMISTIHSQDFETDRLPIGDPERKYDFCAVKLDKLFDTNLNKESSFDEMISTLKEKRIVMIGETHTNQLHHDVQYEIIKGLVESGKPVVLALEMYNPDQDEQLAAWSSGKTDPNTFLEQTDFLTTWSHNYRYYKAIFDYARTQNIPMYGANIDRKYASRIGKDGVEGLTEEEHEAIPEIDTKTVEHEFLIKVYMQGMDATMPQIFPNMYQAQSLWDAAMGEGAIKAAKKHPDATVVVLAGSGHVAYNLGIGRIIKDRSDLSFASVITVDVPEEVEDSGMMKIKKGMKKEKAQEMPPMNKKTDTEEQTKEKASPMTAHSMGMPGMDNSPSRIVVRSLADFLWGKKEMEQEKYPAFGFSLKEKEEKGYLISRVLPETIAAENGLMKGDILISIDGKEFETLYDLKKYLHYMNWDDKVSFKVKRDTDEKEITFVIKPVADDKED